MIGSLFSLAFTKRLERRSSLFQLPIFHAVSPPVAYHVSFKDEPPSVRAVLSDGFLWEHFRNGGRFSGLHPARIRVSQPLSYRLRKSVILEN